MTGIERAMQILGGRVEDVAVICRVSGPAVYGWLKAGRIFDARHAIAVAKATRERGHEVTIEELAGLAPAPEAPAPAPQPGKRRPRSNGGCIRASAPSPEPLHPPTAVGGASSRAQLHGSQRA